MARLTRWNPLWDYWGMTPMLRLSTSNPAATSANAYLPPMDIEETEDQYVVTLSVPGFSQNQLKISLDDNVLHIQGALTSNTDNTEDAAGRKYHLRERHMNRFSRTIHLPDSVDADQIQARYETGVLTLIIPKPVEVAPRQIEIAVG